MFRNVGKKLITIGCTISQKIADFTRKGKGKVRPGQATKAQRGEYRYSPTLSLTSAVSCAVVLGTDSTKHNSAGYTSTRE